MDRIRAIGRFAPSRGMKRARVKSAQGIGSLDGRRQVVSIGYFWKI
jgi:hypothetical protein